jgi:Ser-tRNA(Ala) deacylase AlaX
MNTYLFYRETGFYPIELANDATAIEHVKLNPGTLKVQNAVTHAIVWTMTPPTQSQETAGQVLEAVANKYAAALEASWNEFYKDHHNPVPSHATYAGAIKKAVEESHSALLKRAEQAEERLNQLTRICRNSLAFGLNGASAYSAHEACENGDEMRSLLAAIDASKPQP